MWVELSMPLINIKFNIMGTYKIQKDTTNGGKLTENDVNNWIKKMNEVSDDDWDNDDPYIEVPGPLTPCIKIVHHSELEGNNLYNPMATHWLYVQSPTELSRNEVLSNLKSEWPNLKGINIIQFTEAAQWSAVGRHQTLRGYSYEVHFKVEGYISQYEKGAWIEFKYYLNGNGSLADEPHANTFFGKYNDDLKRKDENTRLSITTDIVDRIYTLEELMEIIKPEGEVLDFKAPKDGLPKPDAYRYTIYLRR